MRGAMVLLLVSIGAAACGRRSSESDEALLARTDGAATRLVTELRARLLAAMPQGPAVAAEVCARDARTIAARVETETGVRVGRGSLRLRNPVNAPPAWVLAWLRVQGERPAAGVVGIRSIEGNQARVLRPIAVEGPCVLCHGPSETLAPPLRTVLTTHYPDDHATGYTLGALRGALWAEGTRR